jgi:carboxylesterase type B
VSTNYLEAAFSILHRIRFAAPPTGSLRWKIPQTPLINRTVIQATDFGPICPQTYPAVPNAPFIPGDEDCLFLNVYAPPFNGAKKLPVLVWIHGGGYGFGDGRQDMSTLMNANGKAFVVVSIQYRVSTVCYVRCQDLMVPAWCIRIPLFLRNQGK